MKIIIAVYIVISSCLLTGCWDTHLLKDNNLVLGVGLDATDEGKILNTSVIRLLSLEGGGKSASTNVIYNATGNTLREIRVDIEKQLGGEYAANKMQVLAIGEELAKEDIYPILDILYRDPRNSLGAKIVITKGTAKELLQIKKSKEVFISEKLTKAVKGAEENTLVPIETLQSICPNLFDPGKDFALPYVIRKDSDSFDIVGIALFHGEKYTGKVLEGQNATVLLYLNGEKGDVGRLVLKVNPEEEQHQDQYISVNTFLKSQSLKVNVDNDHKITVDINVKLNITVIEYPKDGMFSDGEIKKLNKIISDQLTENASMVIKELQLVNCDYFGIGRKIMAYHPKTWSLMDWEETFPTIAINAKIEAKITGNGILK
ncbi:MAG TPA: Ger(x)C family spore germination protein [Candidatus Paenibacillus intestinavium]|nr:Ger(x)C family spore germination protein [Candidatus Paenibacillus intestinavium]